jgi:predicted phosphodiesterase
VSGGTIIYGDPHGDWRPLLRACAEDRPDGVVLLGDCDLAMPLRQQLAPLFEAGIRVRWIPGNHDTDTIGFHDCLWDDYPDGNLHARWAQVGSLIVAGLGGIFKERVWYPRFEAATPVFATRREYLRQLQRTDRWRGGLPLRLRDAIFPEDVDALATLRVDVLVTHEAPSCHRHGFVGIDTAAQACRARLVVHGHHHESYEGVLANGVPVRGLGKAEVLRLRRQDLP